MDIKTTYALSKQMKHPQRNLVPKFMVQGMFALMLSTLALVSYASLSGRAVGSVVPHSDIVREITVTLDGSRSDGVAVLDSTGTQIAHSTKEKSGFIDVVWVSVNRERTVHGVASDAPVRVVRRANGLVAVIDDTTGWKIELIGYGQDNVAAFARLVD
ncbi:photosynthetic complex assembly protein PuhC [Pseudosulfitobacter koreensis]|uniref:Photosynthetic complex assembly protein PuhC n=1 Tax=Pseudosulfitobacter koreensis TaxID=2968472 RepID=A0ABT1YWF7_9RHOB|nr:photosynthetic complex assembly protein PuhC [Pseudosulfitobacter koreense]MCR8825202.1 photosynthetic complex assembly protein PuhC [Pseudosulfitobacter koreense]